MHLSDILNHLNYAIKTNLHNHPIDRNLEFVLNQQDSQIWLPLVPQRVSVRGYIRQTVSGMNDEQTRHDSIMIWDNNCSTTDTYLVNELKLLAQMPEDKVPYLQQYSKHNILDICNSNLSINQKVDKFMHDVFDCDTKYDFIQKIFDCDRENLLRFPIESLDEYSGIALLHEPPLR